MSGRKRPQPIQGGLGLSEIFAIEALLKLCVSFRERSLCAFYISSLREQLPEADLRSQFQGKRLLMAADLDGFAEAVFGFVAALIVRPASPDQISFHSPALRFKGVIPGRRNQG